MPRSCAVIWIKVEATKEWEGGVLNWGDSNTESFDGFEQYALFPFRFFMTWGKRKLILVIALI